MVHVLSLPSCAGCGPSIGRLTSKQSKGVRLIDPLPSLYGPCYENKINK